jgi:hypothetical protein
MSYFQEIYQKIEEVDEGRLKEEQRIRDIVAKNSANIEIIMKDSKSYFKRLNLHDE